MFVHTGPDAEGKTNVAQCFVCTFICWRAAPLARANKPSVFVSCSTSSTPSRAQTCVWNMNFPSLFSLHFPNPNTGARSRRGSVKAKKKQKPKMCRSRGKAGKRTVLRRSATLEPSNASFALYLFFCARLFFLLFSQHRDASLDATQASARCSAQLKAIWPRSATARRIRLSFFGLL